MTKKTSAAKAIEFEANDRVEFRFTKNGPTRQGTVRYVRDNGMCLRVDSGSEMYWVDVHTDRVQHVVIQYRELGQR